ncbi:PREDICTED: metallophosphoesterase domain-containing protein 1 [Rhagoletis zephyria]|uniref:metallophosphoesterase domain-containing protein 1 n=1 Tax=Rhagoletis zephyria TaxID=28612 RepID=UPI0008116429|nr:PREDICTED: metallophosphoesterase domain-containing protein 1 [Rhagoletis zephyria]XP_017478924.1 PREDICTED: metallophosphoesterase domain-containing protein 1 [Rhagoletis zephyria]XP_036339876.1 metallophosphoesterase domain-containing protein 1-like [Rhagoletis pomonella]XP_036339877.1 metallophosphoesterase domain-containing protein 1-like [Rhagoletis pomonella]
MENRITVHPLSHDPTAAWKEISKFQRVVKISLSRPLAEKDSRKVRVVCMSDTHSLTSYLKFDIPNGDIFIHAGDFTKCGRLQEVIEFNNWIATLPHKHKLVIAGNHELSFDKNFTEFLDGSHNSRTKHTGRLSLENMPMLGNRREDIESALQAKNIQEVLSHCTYLEDQLINVMGIRIYGTPWQPEFCKWAFNLPRGEACLTKWNLIPDNVDILVTHTPPVGHGDLCCSGIHAGCVELLNTVQKRVKPKYHVFGHIHEGYGITSDGNTIYVNASTCDINYIPKNPPIVFDVSLPVCALSA